MKENLAHTAHKPMKALPDTTGMVPEEAERLLGGLRMESMMFCRSWGEMRESMSTLLRSIPASAACKQP